MSGKALVNYFCNCLQPLQKKLIERSSEFIKKQKDDEVDVETRNLQTSIYIMYIGMNR